MAEFKSDGSVAVFDAASGAVVQWTGMRLRSDPTNGDTCPTSAVAHTAFS